MDRDAEEPNNQVRYRLDPSSFSTYFSVDTLTGELKVLQALSYPQVREGARGKGGKER